MKDEIFLKLKKTIIVLIYSLYYINQKLYQNHIYPSLNINNQQKMMIFLYFFDVFLYKVQLLFYST